MNRRDASMKIILDLCGGTGAWSEPYRDAGYDVQVITLPDHDIRDFVLPAEPIYGILAAPPCTMFSLARTTAKTPRDFAEGMEVVKACLNIIWSARYKQSLKFWALENPRGYLRQFMGLPPFTFMRCHFGDDGGKPTDLWGYYKAPKKTHPTAKPTRGNDNTESKWYNTVNGNPRKRAITPPGFARAFFKANQ